MEKSTPQPSSMLLKEWIADYIAKHCIEYSELNAGLLMYGKLPGTRYVRQYYLGNLLYNSDMIDYVALEFNRLVKQHIGHFNFQIAGRDFSASPLLTSIPFWAPVPNKINSFLIKRERKNYGNHGYIEGKPNNLPVLLVDDLCNSTDSFRHCYNVCAFEHNLIVMPFCFAVLNKYTKQQGGADHNKDRYAPHLTALTICDGDDIQDARKRNAAAPAAPPGLEAKAV